MNTIKRALHIIRLLRTHEEMSQADIVEHLSRTFPGENKISRATFARDKDFIETNLPFKLVYNERHHTYTLFSRTATYDDDRQVVDYILSNYQAEASAPLLIKHSDKVHHAEIITGTDTLEIVLKAIDEKRGIECDYQSFVNDTKKHRTFIPLFLSTWEGRWYMVAEVDTHPGDMPYTYALERMSNIILTQEHMQPVSKVTIKDYFKDSYGIQHASADSPAMDVIIKASGAQINYLRAKPMHESQEEIELGVFKYRLSPCYNFYQQLLWNRESIEVLEPDEVRNEVKRIATSISNLYNQ